MLFYVQVVVISGSAEAVRTACERVRECVSKVEEKENQVGVGVPVPTHAIGRLIGRGGANIRAIQRESGAKVRAAHLFKYFCILMKKILQNLQLMTKQLENQRKCMYLRSFHS